jgi:hypothetical protein
MANQAMANEFIFPFVGTLSGLHMIDGMAVNANEASKIINNLRRNGVNALIIKATLTLTDLAPYNGLDVCEANGGVELIDSDTGRILSVTNVSRVRGFGNSQDQARRNALKNSAEGIPESFTKQVAANAN